jgi:hypothetical protein
LEAVLVSTGWNRNDDVFDQQEVWAARHTPEDKKFDLEHVGDDIIGHITSVRAVNGEMQPVPDETNGGSLPTKLHLLTGAVLYRVWEKKDLQDRMDKIIAELAEAKWFVSMECLFANFDYALLSPDGDQKVVTRNADTAFLTKYLRVYGGAGTYLGQKIGRVLRTILFTGKGLVRNPANEASVIFPPPTEVARGSLERALARFLGRDDDEPVILSNSGTSLETAVASCCGVDMIRPTERARFVSLAKDIETFLCGPSEVGD